MGGGRDLGRESEGGIRTKIVEDEQYTNASEAWNSTVESLKQNSVQWAECTVDGMELHGDKYFRDFIRKLLTLNIPAIFEDLYADFKYHCK